MLTETKRTDLFCEYYAKWITVYKKGAIRKVTMDKYLMTQKWLVKLIPNLRVCDMNRIAYQQLLNDYAEFHERQTTMDFHHQLKGAILDAVDEGLIERDPTRKAIIKGKPPVAKKIKYLNQFELHTLLISLDLKDKVNWDYFILLVAKTGMRFSEALALTPKDFDFAHQTLSISKTWDYKGKGGFQPTKNKSSVRKIQIDWQTVIQFSELVKHLPEDKPIFVNGERHSQQALQSLQYPCHLCPRITPHTRLFAVVYGRVHCECCSSSWTFEYDHYAKNLSAHHSGTGKQRHRLGDALSFGFELKDETGLR